MKTIVRRLIVVLAIFACTAGSFAAESRKWSGSLTTDFVSQYVGFGNGAVFYPKPMFQNILAVQHQNGLHADIWIGSGLNNNFSRGFDDEWDWNVGWSGMTRKSVQFDVGVGYWDLVDVFDGKYGDIIHPYIEIGRSYTVSSNLTLTPFAKWEGYLLPFGSQFDAGTITSLGSKYEYAISPTLKVTGLTSFAYDDGGFGFSKGFLWKNYLNLEWSITKSFTLRVPRTEVYVPLGISDSREPELVVGLGFLFRF